MNKGACVLHKIANVLVIVGGLNWGLVGLGMFMGSNWNLVNMIFGSMPTIEAIVYILVGVSAVLAIFGGSCSKCQADGAKM
ncbi:MAG: DUF378 domain-containing protein [bacterium]